MCEQINGDDDDDDDDDNHVVRCFFLQRQISLLQQHLHWRLVHVSGLVAGTSKVHILGANVGDVLFAKMGSLKF